MNDNAQKNIQYQLSLCYILGLILTLAAYTLFHFSGLNPYQTSRVEFTLVQRNIKGFASTL